MRRSDPAHEFLNGDLSECRNYLGWVLSRVEASRETKSDLCQESMLKVFQNREQFEGSSLPAALGWVKVIAHNAYKSRRKKEAAVKRHNGHATVRLDDAELASIPMAMPLANSTLDVDLRQLCSAELSDDEYAAIVMKFVEGWRHAEIADVLDRTPSAVSGLIRRALAKLRSALERIENDGSPTQ